MGVREERSRPSKPLLRTAIGGVLRRTRIRQGRTLAEVAGASGVSIPYLSELERGRKEASSEVLAAVCEGLRITLSELMTEVARALHNGRAPRASVTSLDTFRAHRADHPRRTHHGQHARYAGRGATPGHRAGEVQLRLAA